MERLVQVAINAVALWVAVELVPGLLFLDEWWKLLIMAAIFSLLNTFLRPVLRILTLPITIATLGLFLLVINAVMLLITGAVASDLGIAFEVDGFESAVLGAIVISLVGLALSITIGGSRVVRRLV